MSAGMRWESYEFKIVCMPSYNFSCRYVSAAVSRQGIQESKGFLRGSGQKLQQGMMLWLNDSTVVEMLQAVAEDKDLYLQVETWRPDTSLRVNTITRVLLVGKKQKKASHCCRSRT